MTMKMTISNLPRDLVVEIVSRVPLQFMRAVRLTCKNWNALFKSRSFTTMNIGKEEEAARQSGESRMIVLMNNNLYLTNMVVNENPSKEVKAKLTCLFNDSEQAYIYEVFNCEGLLLCNLKYSDTSVVVWNPYLGQTRWIKTKNYDSWDLHKYAIGYGYMKNKSDRSHKILRFVDNCSLFVNGRQFLEYEIYNFDSDLWMTFEFTPAWRIPYRHHGVSLKGNTYWCATNRNYYGRIDHIICFDFTSDRFGPLLSLPFKIQENEVLTLSCVRKQELAVLFQSLDTYMIEMWITTKIEATKVSWSRFLTVDIRPDVSVGSFFIHEEKQVAMVFDQYWRKGGYTVTIVGEDGYIRELVLGESSAIRCLPLVCSYVPSLVQIKKPENGIKEQYVEGGKRRKRDDYFQSYKS